ncbi:hypothetical protein ERJ75_000377100 [Trypanosoma vivax]|nr:hypothetical protein ERJ75_000377100 [Trypanosoma vivax]
MTDLCRAAQRADKMENILRNCWSVNPSAGDDSARLRMSAAGGQHSLASRRDRCGAGSVYDNCVMKDGWRGGRERNNRHSKARAATGRPADRTQTGTTSGASDSRFSATQRTSDGLVAVATGSPVVLHDSAPTL